MGCFKVILSFFLLVSGLLLQLPESSISEPSGPSLQDAVVAANAQGFEANNLFAHLSADCSLPCWNHIRVGETPEELFLESMRELEFSSVPVNASEANEYDEQWRFANNIFIPAEGDPLQFAFAVWGTFIDDTLQMLELLWINYGIIEMLPDMVIEQLGTPDEVHVAYDAVRGRVLWLEYKTLHTDFIYLSFARINMQAFEICADAKSWINPNSTLITFISSPEYPEARLLRIEQFIPAQYFGIYNITEVSSYTAKSFANDVVNDPETCLVLDEEFVSGIDG